MSAAFVSLLKAVKISAWILNVRIFIVMKGKEYYWRSDDIQIQCNLSATATLGDKISTLLC